MRIRKIAFLVLSLFTLSTAAMAAEPAVGLVNFPKCVAESKYGKQEQEAFEQVKKQMTTLVSDLEKQLQEIAGKFNDAEFLDSLSPEAEQELKGKFQTLSDEYNRYQNQYMQVLQQANMKLVQVMKNHITHASEVIAKQNKLSLVIQEEACFYYNPSHDITAQIVKEMDRSYEKENKTPTTAQVEPAKK